MKKWIAMLTAALMLLSFHAVADEVKVIKVVATTFPVYDWARQVIGTDKAGVELILLQDSGADPHSFQPSAEDFVNVTTADVFIYIGGLSDNWVADALSEAHNKEMVALNLMDALGSMVKADALTEGMQESEHAHDHDHEGEEAHDHDHEDEEAHNHDHEDEEAHDHEHEGEDAHDHEHEGEDAHADEHIWLSLKNAQVLVPAIRDALIAADPAHENNYTENAAAYLEKLSTLDKSYQQIVNAYDQPTLLFGDRFPFRYLMEDYGITYYAAFQGCSAETEASFETIIFLADKLDELQLKSIIKLDGSDGRIAEGIVRASQSRDQQLLTLDAMQSVNRDDVQSGVTYLSIMEKNLETLEAGLKK